MTTMQYKLKGLEKVVTTLQGGVIMLTEKDQLTYAQAIISACEMYKPEAANTGQSIRAFGVGINIQNHKNGEVVISEEDYKFLKDIIIPNAGYIAVVAGRLNQLLEKVEQINN